MNTTRPRRSNRPLTKFACDYLDRFLSNDLGTWSDRNTNTSIKCEASAQHRTFSVFFHGQELLSLALEGDEPMMVRIGLGDKFCDDGSPTRTVLERLNGILDTLGWHGVIPEGVRVFKDKEEGIFYLGKGDDKVAVGRKFAQMIFIRPDEHIFDIQSTDMPSSKAERCFISQVRKIPITKEAFIA